MFRTYAMDSTGYTPHIFENESQFKAWALVNQPRRMYVRAEGLRGRCKTPVDHRGESSRMDGLDETPMLEAFEREYDNA